MKILYIGTERSDAQAVATALRGIDHGVSVTWAARLELAVNWLEANRALAALVVDAQTHGGSWPAILTHVRELALHPAVVVIVPDGTGPFEAFHPDAHDYIVRNQSLLQELPIVVARSIARAWGQQRADLEQKLVEAKAALQDTEHRHRTAIEAAEAVLAERHAQYEIGMARAAATWDMVDEQLRTAAIEVERARHDQAAAAADVDRLLRRESELTSQLADAAATQAALEHRLADAETAVADANARAGQERLTAAEQLATREREFQRRIAQELDRRRIVEGLLAQAVNARDDAEKRHTSAMTDAVARSRELETALEVVRQDLESKVADVERLAARETELNALLSDLTTTRTDLERRLAATEAAFEDAGTRATRERLAASKKAAEREAELDGLIRQERVTRTKLEQAIADTETALRDAQRHHDAAMTAAVSEHADHQAQFDRERSELVNDRDRLAQQLSEAEVDLDRMRKEHESLASDVDRLTQRNTALSSELTAVEGARGALEMQLADTATALADAKEHAARDAESAADRRTKLERALADAETALRDAQQRHDAAMTAAAREHADRQAQFDRERSELVNDRDRLAQQLSEAEVDLDRIRKEHESLASDVDRLTQRNTALSSQLEAVETARGALETQLADTASALADTRERAERDGEAAADRQADLEARLAREGATRAALEQAIADADVARRDAQIQHDGALTAAANELAERTADFERALSKTVDERERLSAQLSDAELAFDQLQRDYESMAADVARLTQCDADLSSRLSDVEAVRNTLEQQLTDAVGALAMAEERATREHAVAAERQAELESRLGHQIAAIDVLERTLADTRAAAFEAARSLSEEIESLRANGREQIAQFELQLAQERLVYEQQLADVQESTRRLAVERDALRQQLDESRAESERLFEHAGLAMFRCTRDGALIEANRACTSLIGRRTIEELHGVDFTSAVFDAPNVLSWLIEQCVSTRAKESVETTWRRKEGGRLFVRLSGRLLASDVIEIAVDDLTRVRVLQERLGQANRMEAVGRLASEVAVTCGNLLSDIHQKGREWLDTDSGDVDSRHQGELLFDEVGRAAGLLRQLADCGDEQARTPMLVDLNTLIHDLEPVLKRVAGGAVEVQLRDTGSPLTVDVGTDRVERLLVNLASYGRERMPFGGRLQIELSTSVVDRRFAAKHPNVRLGRHALITVTETRSTHTNNVPQERDGSASRHSRGSATPRPGVDFGTLQGLVNECGGHLWMQVQPPGDMVAKIRLPLSNSNDQPLPRPVTVRGRDRTTVRLFQS